MALLGYALACPKSVGYAVSEWTRNIQGERTSNRVRILLKSDV